MDTEAQRQIEHVFAVLDQNVFVAGLAVGDAWHIAVRLPFRQHGGRGGALRHGSGCGRGGCYRPQTLDASILGPLQRQRLIKVDGDETNRVAGFQLPDLPQFGLGDGHRADEAAETRAVLGQDHREVAGEVDRTDGVLVIVQVGRMQPGFAAVGARPGGFRAGQADTQAVGVVVHLIVSAEEGIDGLLGEIIRRAVGTVQYLDFPMLRIVRDQCALRR